MTASLPDPQHQQEWPTQPTPAGPIQDPVPQELEHQSPAPYQTFATVRPGTSGVALTITRPNTGVGLARLRVQIDDRLIPAETGTVFVTLPPGRHTVTFDRVGTDDTRTIMVDVPPAQAVPLYYALPYWIGARSALSPTPVDTPGLGSFRWFLAGTVGGVVLFAVIAIVIGFLFI